MLKRYLEFINESFELILESDVIYSDKFRLALSKIDSDISKSLLGIENKDLTVRSNYFDIVNDRNDSVSFIPDARAQRILGEEKETVQFIGRGGGWLTFNKNDEGEYKNRKLFDELGFTPGEELVQPGDDEIGEVLKKVVSEKSGKTYAWVKFPSTELVINVDKLRSVDERLNKVWNTNRQQIRIGRAIRALLKAGDVEFVDKDVETFVNQYKAVIDKFNDKFSYFEEVKGDDISHWYDEEHYYSGRGTLGSSCMACAPSSFFDIYVSNPDVCSLVILKSQDNDKQLTGRALLWKTTDDKMFMDRIYTNNDSDIELFKEYAKENGWYVKRYNGSSAGNYVIAPSGEIEQWPKLEVSIKTGSYDNYPYLDTLKYLYRSKGILSTRNGAGSVTLEDTDGNYYGCERCDNSGETECYECDGRGDYECHECDGDGHVGKGDDKEECDRCEGEGRIECSDCDGRGVVPCYDCQ